MWACVGEGGRAGVIKMYLFDGEVQRPFLRKYYFSQRFVTNAQRMNKGGHINYLDLMLVFCTVITF